MASTIPRESVRTSAFANLGTALEGEIKKGLSCLWFLTDSRCGKAKRAGAQDQRRKNSLKRRCHRNSEARASGPDSTQSFGQNAGP